MHLSQTPALAAAYRAQVEAVLAGLPPPRYGPLPLYRRAVQRGALRLELTGGAVRITRIGAGGGRPDWCDALPGGALRCRTR